MVRQVDIDVIVPQDAYLLQVSCLVKDSIIPGRRFLLIVGLESQVKLVRGHECDLALFVGGDIPVICQRLFVPLEQWRQQFGQFLSRQFLLPVPCLNLC